MYGAKHASSDTYPKRRSEPTHQRIEFIAPYRKQQLLEGGFRKQREEALHPAVHRAAINHEAALGEPRHDVRVAEAVAHGVADGHGTHVVEEAVVREGRLRAGGEAAPALIAAPPLAAEACVRPTAPARSRTGCIA